MAEGKDVWSELCQYFSARGVRRIYLKRLAPAQDNERNQIYLCKDTSSVFDGISNLFPLSLEKGGISTSRTKRRSMPGAHIWSSPVRWHWVDEQGEAHAAPHTKLILYFQYPEARLSGFLRGAAWSPDSVRRLKQAAFGSRLMVFGAADDGAVYARVLNSIEHPDFFPDTGFSPHPRNPLLLFREVRSGGVPRLLSDLKGIRRQGWHDSVRLKSKAEGPKPFSGTQGGGYTLEALLGIESNASKAPDRDGIEIKSCSGRKVSLMTPSPDGGYQGTNGLVAFLNAYGKADSSDRARLVFNGVHRCGKPNAKTGMSLVVEGYELGKGFTSNEASVKVKLLDRDGGEAASWSYPRIFESWSKKHELAAYVSVESQRAESGSGCRYRFARTVWVCEGTSPSRLIEAILRGVVVYDPGDTSKSGDTGKPKARPQWRLANVKDLKHLYENVTVHEFP